MVTTRKPESIEVIIRNRDGGKSRSFTVYDTTVDELYKKLLSTLKGK